MASGPPAGPEGPPSAQPTLVCPSALALLLLCTQGTRFSRPARTNTPGLPCPPAAMHLTFPGFPRYLSDHPVKEQKDTCAAAIPDEHLPPWRRPSQRSLVPVKTGCEEAQQSHARFRLQPPLGQRSNLQRRGPSKPGASPQRACATPPPPRLLKKGRREMTIAKASFPHLFAPGLPPFTSLPESKESPPLVAKGIKRRRLRPRLPTRSYLLRMREAFDGDD